MLPHVIPFTFEEEANFGDMAQVSCYATKGDMPMIFSWMRNGAPISPQNKGIAVNMFGTKTSLLSIASVDWHHAGNYTCVVANKAGISTQSAELLVKGIIL